MSELSAADRWLPIPGWEGYYEASDCGQIRSLDRPSVTHLGGRYVRRGKQLKQIVISNGYCHVELYAPGRHLRTLWHRIILLTFAGVPLEHASVGCHKDDDPGNNRLDNLRWDDQSGNIHDSVAHGNHRNTRKVTCKRKHEFVGKNLVVAVNIDKHGIVHPARQCRSCIKANATIRCLRRAGRPVPDRQTLADACYAELTGCNL